MAVSLDGVKHKKFLLYLIKEMESSFDLSPFLSTVRIDQIFKFVAINIIKVVFLFMPKLARKWINAVGPISSSFMVKLILFMVKIIIIGRSIVFAYICFIYVFILIPWLFFSFFLEFRSLFPQFTGVLTLAFFIHNCVITLLKNNKNQENNVSKHIFA